LPAAILFSALIGFTVSFQILIVHSMNQKRPVCLNERIHSFMALLLAPSLTNFLRAGSYLSLSLQYLHVNLLTHPSLLQFETQSQMGYLLN